MARPLSWLSRLHTIRRAVENSPRSHYGRRDLERLFELQPRAAGKLLESLPTISIGTSKLVERDPLLALLEAMVEAEDPAAVLAAARTRPPATARRTLRQLLPRDQPPASWETLPASLTLEVGSVAIAFTRVEELAAALLALASLLEADLEGFAEKYELRPQANPPENNEDVQAMFAALTAMETFADQEAAG